MCWTVHAARMMNTVYVSKELVGTSWRSCFRWESNIRHIFWETGLQMRLDCCPSLTTLLTKWWTSGGHKSRIFLNHLNDCQFFKENLAPPSCTLAYRCSFLCSVRLWTVFSITFCRAVNIHLAGTCMPQFFIGRRRSVFMYSALG